MRKAGLGDLTGEQIFHKFFGLVKRIEENLSKTRLFMFGVFDTNRDKDVSVAELRGVMEEMDFTLSEGKWGEFVGCMGKEKGGRISFDEFVEMMGRANLDKSYAWVK